MSARPEGRPVRAIVTADDFGLSVGVNEAVEEAHRKGLLTTASLMVAGEAAGDAIRRARRLPGLGVGLHLVAVDGAAAEPAGLDGLVDAAGEFPSRQLGLAVRFFFSPDARRRLWREIGAQFAAFRRSGLTLDHANAHKHMHMHPTVGGMLIRAGLEHGLAALRVPAEPAGPLAASGTRVGLGGRALASWAGLLRARALRAGLRVNDAAFGIAWSGHMTTDRLIRLAPNLPPGLNEIYFHPSARRDGPIPRRMPDYEHEAELRALLDPAVREAFARAGVAISGWRS